MNHYVTWTLKGLQYELNVCTYETFFYCICRAYTGEIRKDLSCMDHLHALFSCHFDNIN